MLQVQVLLLLIPHRMLRGGLLLSFRVLKSPLRRWVHLGLPLPALPLRVRLEEVLEGQRVDRWGGPKGGRRADLMEDRLEAQWVARWGGLMEDRLEGQ